MQGLLSRASHVQMLWARAQQFKKWALTQGEAIGRQLGYGIHGVDTVNRPFFESFRIATWNMKG